MLILLLSNTEILAEKIPHCIMYICYIIIKLAWHESFISCILAIYQLTWTYSVKVRVINVANLSFGCWNEITKTNNHHINEYG